MRIALFYHSVRSDWNHGNAHFLRGVASELIAQGHTVQPFEPEDAWSVANLLQDAGPDALTAFSRVYPTLKPRLYQPATLDLEQELDGFDLVIVHEWNEHDLVARIGEHRARNDGYRLLFHDTHHRSLTRHADIARYDLRHYDGVLAFGEVIRDRYLAHGWCERAWTWHEAADTRVFRPLVNEPPEGDLVWVGNWGDDERTSELAEFLFEPASDLGLRTRIHGVRYPRTALEQLDACGIDYGGWLANFDVPRVFARHKVTVHIPRRPYVESLPGIPTIRPFEAMACGIPLVTSPWEDSEGLFHAGSDYLVASSGDEMRRHLRDLISDPAMASELGMQGHRTLLERHTCAHRVDELLYICRELGMTDVFRNQGETKS
ncbi:CgeB family protein [Thiohalomonas denitrificans]|uniref:CgeB family protein n=1 Tax=Thiohalomonas denitrificans TaxID=415747 RepID=UPI0026F22347|nr:glycosyltransferase [Thiohalomonas denitrificans]